MGREQLPRLVAALAARRFADGPTACLLGALTMRGLALAFSPPEKNLEEIAGIQEALREAQVLDAAQGRNLLRAGCRSESTSDDPPALLPPEW